MSQKIYSITSLSLDRFTGRAQTHSWPKPLFGAIGTIATWYERWRQRQHLKDLDDHLLKDIGLSRAEAEGEAARPFWR